MISLGKMLLAFAFVLVIAVAAVVGLPTLAGFRPDAAPFAYARFAHDGGSFAAPGGWTVIDPYGPGDRYEGPAWGDALPPYPTRIAYLQAPGTRVEALLFCGEARDLEPMLAGRLALLEVSTGPRIDATVRTVAGLDLQYRTFRTERQGERTSHLLAWGRTDERLFVMSAAGPADAFDAAPLLQTLRTVRLPRAAR